MFNVTTVDGRAIQCGAGIWEIVGRANNVIRSSLGRLLMPRSVHANDRAYQNAQIIPRPAVK